jgi:hypothetical protein
MFYICAIITLVGMNGDFLNVQKRENINLPTPLFLKDLGMVFIKPTTINMLFIFVVTDKGYIWAFSPLMRQGK